MNAARVTAVVLKEWREILRDRIYFLLAFFLPIVLMVVFGYGMTQEIDDIPFAVSDYDRTALSREYTHRFIESRYFDFKGHLRSVNQADTLLTGGDVQFVIVIPEGFQERLLGGQQTEVQTLMDGALTMPLRTIDGYVEAINSAATSELQIEYLTRKHAISPQRAQNILQPIKLEIRYLYNQELRDIWSVAPSLIMFNLMLSAPMLMALSVVREKEIGTIFNIYASTISRAEYLLGKLIPNVIVSYINGIILMLMAIYYFGAPFKGSTIFFLSALLVYVICASCMGLLISLWVKTQMAAIIVTIVSIFVIAMQFSGMMAPVSSMTGVNYFLAHSFPPKYFNDIVSATFLKGGGLMASWQELLVLFVFFVGFYIFAYLMFHKRGKT